MNETLEQEYLYERIARKLNQQIQGGVFEVGERLPSIRKLCVQERVSVASVMQALSVLEARGLVEARPKRGYFVRRRRIDRSSQPLPSDCVLKPHAVGVSDIVAQVFRQVGDEEKVPLGAGVPSMDLLPMDRLSRFLANAIREKPEHLGRYGSSSGDPELIRQLARRFTLIGCTIALAEIVITVGAMESLNLGIRAVTQTGDTVVAESPC